MPSKTHFEQWWKSARKVPRRSTVLTPKRWPTPLLRHQSFCPASLKSHLICPLTAKVVGAPRMISQPVFSIFPFSTAFWDLANSKPVHSPMLSSRLFFCLPCLLPLFTVPCKMVSARPDKPDSQTTTKDYIRAERRAGIFSGFQRWAEKNTLRTLCMKLKSAKDWLLSELTINS